MPPSSLYCCQKSVSRISAAARNLKIAASPLLSLDEDGLSARALTAPPSGPKPAPTPTATPLAMNARRERPFPDSSAAWAIFSSRLDLDSKSVELRMASSLGVVKELLTPQ